MTGYQSKKNMAQDKMAHLTLEQRCRLSEQCLPEAPYRAMLTKLHDEMLAALTQPEQEPVAWISATELLVMRGNALGGAKDWRVNLGLEPEEGDVGLYTTPPPCPTCEALARTVMMDQTGRDA